MSDHGHHRHGEQGSGHGHHRDRHGNPEHFDHYLSKLEDPERVTWQQPDAVVAALGLRPGDVACDAGAGPGYFAIRLARAVAPGGRVHAIDVDPRMTALLEQRARDAGVADAIRPLLAPDGAGLPPEPCDAILVVNTFHHFPDGAAHLARLATRLKPGGRIANVDFHAGELPVGPTPDHKVSREAFLAAAAEAGLAIERELTFLPYQYFVVLRPR
jgi:ubiquinone/menaquinone biosynthesis C-methylase UbiE